jgi:uncharacterized cupin superfamily protein
VSDEYADNLWIEDLGETDEGTRGVRLRRAPGSTLGAALWELDPGAAGPYHLHHGTEELLIVLRGRLTLRTPDGERELAEGDVAHFPRGRDGAHGVANRSDGVVRYVMAAAHGTPDVIEYPDRGEIAAIARTPGATGEPLFAMLPFGDGLRAS